MPWCPQASEVRIQYLGGPQKYIVLLLKHLGAGASMWIFFLIQG